MTEHGTPPPAPSSDIDQLRALNHTLMQALQAKAETPVTLLRLPQDGTEPRLDALVGVLLILWGRARREADAYRQWLEQPAPVRTETAVGSAADSASVHFHDRPQLPRRELARTTENNVDENSRPRPRGDL
ncbi:hypothetical protein ACODT5_00160 [Streptomyces sp. 5.8]|uniref:hypothetical protein n=1 Tax=Streptomyces sp. 5.8 TaxID=3406571 RepID=UPI003BB57D6E